MNFGVPSKRRSSTKVEKYDFPVVTLVPAEGKKKVSGIIFNEKAEELMGFGDEAQVGFSFDDGKIMVVNADNSPSLPDDYKLRVTKSSPRKVSNKQTFKYIIETRELDDSVENEFLLEARTIDGISLCEFMPMPDSSSGGDIDGNADGNQLADDDYSANLADDVQGQDTDYNALNNIGESVIGDDDLPPSTIDTNQVTVN